MSITDELRRYISGPAKSGISHICEKAIVNIADRIDAEYEKACDDAWDNGYEADYLGIEKWLAEHPQAMEHHGWVRLPLDADGMPFHIGELVDEKLPFGGYAAPAPIDTMELYRDASGYGWMAKLDAESRALISPKLLRHHRAPTVEDVLREFAKRWDDPAHYAKGELVETFAAKLRLAENNDGLYEWERDEW